MAKEFEGKVVVVTGSSRGIGRAIAAAFAREGAQTVLAASNGANLADGAKTVAGAGGPAPMTVAGDLRTLAGCQALFATVNERFKRCDVLINNAGATKGGKFLEQSDELWLDGFALKLHGAVRVTRLFWPLLKAARGSIVSVVGGAARTPGPEFLIGGAVNAAVANFTKGLMTLGNRDDINVNVIHPGRTDTERTDETVQQMAKAQGKTPEQIRATDRTRLLDSLTAPVEIEDDPAGVLPRHRLDDFQFHDPTRQQAQRPIGVPGGRRSEPQGNHVSLLFSIQQFFRRRLLGLCTVECLSKTSFHQPPGLAINAAAISHCKAGATVASLAIGCQ